MMTFDEYCEIIDKSNAEIIKETGYHYKTLQNRIIDICKKPSRIFKPIALYVFSPSNISQNGKLTLGSR